MTDPNFLSHWFEGLQQGLEEIEPAARETILRCCGQACARSYTAAVFRETWAGSDGIEDFFARLGERFPEADYARLPGGEIRVRYSECGCDLVREGLVDTPLWCACSAHNLRANFEAALGAPVTVRLEQSILRGDPHCQLLVAWGEQSGASARGGEGTI